MDHTPLLRLLQALLNHLPDVTLRRGIPSLGGVAEVEFNQRLITLGDIDNLGAMHAGLAHELVHLLRGPAFVGQEQHEERVVHEHVARLLVPRHHLPAILGGVDPTRIAEDHVIDLHTARLAIRLAHEDTALGVA